MTEGENPFGRGSPGAIESGSRITSSARALLGRRRMKPRSSNAVMSLYLGDHRGYHGPDPRHHAVTRAVNLAEQHDVGWISIPGTWWGVGIILPVPLVGDMLQYCIPRTEVYDLRLTRWCQHAGLTCYYPWPSLIDHADSDSIVTPGRTPGRVARRHLGTHTSALKLHPSATTVAITPQPGAWPPRAWRTTLHRPEQSDYADRHEVPGGS